MTSCGDIPGRSSEVYFHFLCLQSGIQVSPFSVSLQLSKLKYQRLPDKALVRLPPVKSNATMQDIETLDSNRRPIPLISPASRPNLDTKCKVQTVLRWLVTIKVAIRHFHVTVAGIKRAEGGDDSMDNHAGAKNTIKKLLKKGNFDSDNRKSLELPKSCKGTRNRNMASMVIPHIGTDME